MVIDRKNIENRIRKLRDAKQVLQKLSRQKGPRGLSKSEQSELKKYDRWLASSSKEIDKLARYGERLLRIKGEKALGMQQSFNLQYLQLQRMMQGQNRQFTMISNIMKVKHDTAKAAINNIR
jgi:hypothetical protein